jgi:hypothetical protein
MEITTIQTLKVEIFKIDFVLSIQSPIQDTMDKKAGKANGTQS